jgi:hypothetical protein
VSEAEQLTRDSGNRILMDGKMVPVFTLETEASYAPLEGPVALASKADLERILLCICSVSQVARTVAAEMLSITRTNAAPGMTEGSKRKASDAETVHRCSRCKMRFEMDENLPKDCKYHPGKYIQVPRNVCPSWLKTHPAGRKDVDYEATYSDDDMEVWADHCEKTWGAPETMADHPDYQQGFSWSCCERRGDAEGCKAREHDVWVKRANV